MRFEWDPAKRQGTLPSMASRSKKRQRGSATSCRQLAQTLTIPPTKSDSSPSACRPAAVFWLSPTSTVTIQSGSSAHGQRHRLKGRSMKKASRRATEDLRPEYKRSDFGALVRGKYAQRVSEASNVVVLDPQVAKAFPNDRAVNKALRGLLRNRKSSARPTTRSTRTRRERRAG